MNTGFLTSHNNQPTGNKSDTPSVVDTMPERDTSPLRWWYRFTAPAPVRTDATLQERELVRRGRLTSTTLLVVILLLLASEPVGIWGPNKNLVFILLIPLGIDIIALILNKFGRITAAGILVIIGIEVGVGLATFGPALSGGGLTTYTLPQYDLLAQAEFVAVTLLPPGTVFLMAAFNCVFIVASVTFLPHSVEFAPIWEVNRYEIFLRPFILQIIVAFVTYAWVTSAYQALKRADRAEVIAALEHREAERQQQEIALKQQLDEGIQEILQTHVQVANGDFSARTPLRQENVLWRIAYSLNNLLARLQSLSSAENELQRAKSEVIRLAEAIHRAKQGQPVRLNRTGTHLDPLILELMASPMVRDTALNSPPTLDQDHQPPYSGGKKETRDFRL